MKLRTAFVAALVMGAAVAATGCGHVMMMMHARNVARPPVTELGTTRALGNGLYEIGGVRFNMSTRDTAAAVVVNVAKAIAAYERTIEHALSRFDRCAAFEAFLRSLGGGARE